MVLRVMRARLLLLLLLPPPLLLLLHTHHAHTQPPHRCARNWTVSSRSTLRKAAGKISWLP